MTGAFPAAPRDDAVRPPDRPRAGFFHGYEPGRRTRRGTAEPDRAGCGETAGSVRHK
jgi:hypothetical protein